METMTKLTDEELVGLYIKGNNAAFNTLLDRYESKVFTYIMHFTKNQEVTEDLFQDTFMRVITTLRSGRYTEQQKFSSWLMRIAHNQAIDYIRQAKMATIVSDDETPAGCFNDARLADDNNIEQQMIQQQDWGQMESVIRQLPANQQEIIYMRYFEDLSFKEISQKLGCSINTALGRVRYALINMRKLVAQTDISMAS
ncbi:MAG: sigma-70 family RNA polymerase sigma factor [Bacteroidaceae bacterium]|nr:sigma-70 family RNA polymerase sigma factor [Bacteroidaceae bacterium]